MKTSEAALLADIMKALGHPIRVLLVEALSRGDRSVGELTELAAVDPSAISRHLAQLKRVGILTDRREGMRVIYHLQTPCILRAFDCSVEVIRSHRRARPLALRSFAAPSSARRS